MSSDDDDDEINERDIKSAVADHASERMVAPRLRRFITEAVEVPEDDLKLAKVSSDHSTRSANQLMRSCEDLEEHQCQQSKYLAHTRLNCKHELFANPINCQGRNLFA